MLQKIAHRLTRKPKLVVAVALLMLIPSFIGMAATRINYDILTYLPKDLDSARGEKLLEDPFNDAAISMLIVEDMPSGYTEDLVEQIRKVPGVSNVIWSSDLIGIQFPVEMLPQDLKEMFYAGDSTMMLIQYEKAGASDETMNAIGEIRKLCNQKCFLAGFSVIIKDTRDLVDKEMPLYICLAVVLSMVAMSFTLESWLLPGAFLGSIGLAIAYNFGTNIFLGEISYITKAIAAILQLGVTMDYSIFLYRRYEEELPKHDDKRDAMAAAIQAAFTSLSGSSLTTIFGFLALCFMQLTLGRDIGLVMAKGVVLGVATVILVLPAILLCLDGPIRKYRHPALNLKFEKLNELIVKHRVAFFVAALLLAVPALYAQKNTAVYYKLDESLPKDMPSIVANNKLKEDYEMASTHFVILDKELSATQLNEMEERLRAVPGVTAMVSYHSLVGSGIPDFFLPKDVRNIFKNGGYQLMMLNSSYPSASDEAGEQIEQIKKIVKEYDSTAYLTGEAALTDDLIVVANHDFTVTNYISIAAIFLIILLLFGSVTVPLVLVAAIELAICLNQGVPYFTGTVIPFISPTVIGCIQLGATVDYAILMATRFREEIQAGRDRKEAVMIAAKTSDASIITSSLVLFCATMGVGMISKIEIISSICAMLARGALISALVSIFVMPAALCVCEPLIAKTSLYWKHPRVKRNREAAVPAGEAALAQAQIEKSPSEQPFLEESPLEQTSFGERALGQASFEQTALKKTSSEEALLGASPLSETTSSMDQNNTP